MVGMVCKRHRGSLQTPRARSSIRSSSRKSRLDLRASRTLTMRCRRHSSGRRSPTRQPSWPARFSASTERRSGLKRSPLRGFLHWRSCRGRRLPIPHPRRLPLPHLFSAARCHRTGLISGSGRLNFHPSPRLSRLDDRVADLRCLQRIAESRRGRLAASRGLR